MNALNMLDASACRAWWLRRLHPAGAACPGCGVIVEGRRLDRWESGGRLHCAGCGKWFDNQTGTPLDTCRADWKQLTVIASLIPAGVTPAQVALVCHLSEDTVRRISKRLHLYAPTLTVIPSSLEQARQFSHARYTPARLKHLVSPEVSQHA